MTPYKRAKRSHTFGVLKSASLNHYCAFHLLSRCFSRKLCDEKHKQWINVKLFIKLKITLTECYYLLKEAVVRILYLVFMFSNGINCFLKAERALKMTNILINLSQLHKQWPKSMKLCVEIIVWVFGWMLRL